MKTQTRNFLWAMILFGGIAPFLLNAIQAQQTDPFYLSLLQKAEKTFVNKNYEEARRDLEIAAFGLVANKGLRAKALIYLGLCTYYRKDIKTSERYLREATELMGNEGLAGLQIHESALPDLEKLLTFFSIQTVSGGPPAEEVDKPATDNSGTALKPEVKPPAENKPAASQNTTIPTKPLSDIKEGDLLPLGMVDTLPTVIKRVNPIYPPAAKRFKLGGTVIVNTLISEKGEVLKSEIIQGLKGAFGFNQESQRAVRQWKFNPASIKGIKVKVWIHIAIDFKAEGTEQLPVLD